jgi:hypothetical protein
MGCPVFDKPERCHVRALRPGLRLALQLGLHAVSQDQGKWQSISVEHIRIFITVRSHGIWAIASGRD